MLQSINYAIFYSSLFKIKKTNFNVKQYKEIFTTKFGPLDSFWQFFTSCRQSSVVLWSSVASSRTPQRMSTIYIKTHFVINKWRIKYHYLCNYAIILNIGHKKWYFFITNKAKKIKYLLSLPGLTLFFQAWPYNFFDKIKHWKVYSTACHSIWLNNIKLVCKTYYIFSLLTFT